MEKNRIRALRSGDTTRISYSKINEVLEMPNLIEVQKNSYQWFLDEGLKEVFEDISPITDFSGNLILEFIDFSLDSEPKYSIEECRERDATYAASLRVKARLYNRELRMNTRSTVRTVFFLWRNAHFSSFSYFLERVSIAPSQ